MRQHIRPVNLLRLCKRFHERSPPVLRVEDPLRNQVRHRPPRRNPAHMIILADHGFRRNLRPLRQRSLQNQLTNLIFHIIRLAFQPFSHSRISRRQLIIKLVIIILQNMFYVKRGKSPGKKKKRKFNRIPIVLQHSPRTDEGKRGFPARPPHRSVLPENAGKKVFRPPRKITKKRMKTPLTFSEKSAI